MATNGSPKEIIGSSAIKSYFLKRVGDTLIETYICKFKDNPKTRRGIRITDNKDIPIKANEIRVYKMQGKNNMIVIELHYKEKPSKLLTPKKKIIIPKGVHL